MSDKASSSQNTDLRIVNILAPIHPQLLEAHRATKEHYPDDDKRFRLIRKSLEAIGNHIDTQTREGSDGDVKQNVWEHVCQHYWPQSKNCSKRVSGQKLREAYEKIMAIKGYGPPCKLRHINTAAGLPCKVRYINTTIQDFSAKQITIVVGSSASRKTFYAHAELLKTHSDFFAAALSNGWKEANEHLIHLPETDAEQFQAFVRFIYYADLYLEDFGKAAASDAEYEFIGKCWLLGDKLLSASFRDAAVDALRDKVNETGQVPVGLDRVIYPQTVSVSGLRRLLVDIAV